jgi:hypothetical protein
MSVESSSATAALFERWSCVDPLTVLQVAFLWAGLEPVEYDWQLPPDKKSAVTPLIQMLSSAIITQELRADVRHNPMASIGIHETSLVKRADLIDFSSGRKQRPGFLFVSDHANSNQRGSTSPLQATVELRPQDQSSPAQEKSAPSPPQPPTYAPVVTYSPDRVPQEFTAWAYEEHTAGNLITERLAMDAMCGKKNAAGTRTGGRLIHGKGLSRDTVRAWIKTVPPHWVAKRGEPPSR